ncbi:hypothetical protein D9M72_583620 [compost metagenome]
MVMIAVSLGGTLRDTTVCSAMTSEAPITTGSTALSGMAPWPPVPWMTMVALSVEAMQGPASTPKRPTGMPGELCRANRASQGNRRNTPSSSMRLAPEPP